MSLFKGIGKIFSSATKLVGGVVGDLLGVQTPKVDTPPPVPTMDDAQAAAELERKRLKSQAGYMSTLSGGLLDSSARAAGAGVATKTALGA